jgi:FtsP/CotA-like multicopper oxidase with cupredoxin domain
MSLSMLGAAPVVRDFDLAIAKRRIEGAAPTIRVKQGETILIRWRSDEPVRLHLHGYDLHAEVSPSSPAHMRFEATAAGRFSIAAHRSGARETTLIYIEVLPP